MGRTKQGNANANRNNNKKLGNRTSEELVEFSTGEKGVRNPDLKDENIGKQQEMFSGRLSFEKNSSVPLSYPAM